jgi:hypothetical protein
MAPTNAPPATPSKAPEINTSFVFLSCTDNDTPVSVVVVLGEVRKFQLASMPPNAGGEPEVQLYLLASGIATEMTVWTFSGPGLVIDA